MGGVPVSEALRRLSEDPRFWSLLFVHDGAFPDPDPVELRVSLPVTGGYGLVLDLDLVTGEQTLGLREPATSEPVQLGWAAPGRPYPAALRWHELELCARVIALEDPTLPHPGLVVALLSPFAPPTTTRARWRRCARPRTDPCAARCRRPRRRVRSRRRCRSSRPRPGGPGRRRRHPR